MLEIKGTGAETDGYFSSRCRARFSACPPPTIRVAPGSAGCALGEISHCSRASESLSSIVAPARVTQSHPWLLHTLLNLWGPSLHCPHACGRLVCKGELRTLAWPVAMCGARCGVQAASWALVHLSTFSGSDGPFIPPSTRPVAIGWAGWMGELILRGQYGG